MDCEFQKIDEGMEMWDDPRVQRMMASEFRKFNEQAKLNLDKQAFFAAQNNIINAFISPQV